MALDDVIQPRNLPSQHSATGLSSYIGLHPPTANDDSQMSPRAIPDTQPQATTSSAQESFIRLPPENQNSGNQSVACVEATSSTITRTGTTQAQEECPGVVGEYACLNWTTTQATQSETGRHQGGSAFTPGQHVQRQSSMLPCILTRSSTIQLTREVQAPTVVRPAPLEASSHQAACHNSGDQGSNTMSQVQSRNDSAGGNSNQGRGDNGRQEHSQPDLRGSIPQKLFCPVVGMLCPERP